MNKPDQASSDPLREALNRQEHLWRVAAVTERIQGGSHRSARASVFEQCANELEALLGDHAPAPLREGWQLDEEKKDDDAR